jgi:hypothetical protein
MNWREFTSYFYGADFKLNIRLSLPRESIFNLIFL